MAKKEKLVDLKPEKVKEEDLKELQKQVSNMNQTYIELGRLSASQHMTLHKLAGFQDEMVMLQEKMKKEYGTNDISIGDGTINYPKENGKADKKD